MGVEISIFLLCIVLLQTSFCTDNYPRLLQNKILDLCCLAILFFWGGGGSDIVEGCRKKRGVPHFTVTKQAILEAFLCPPIMCISYCYTKNSATTTQPVQYLYIEITNIFTSLTKSPPPPPLLHNHVSMWRGVTN